MLKKIRGLKQLLRKAGFEKLPGKVAILTGYICFIQAKITVSGKDGAYEVSEEPLPIPTTVCAVAG